MYTTTDLLVIKLLVNRKMIIETLERLGIANKVNKDLFPSCYLYSDDEGIDYLVHFKQVFILTRKDSYNNLSQDDIKRRNTIARLLKQWNMIDVDDASTEPNGIYVYTLPYREKRNWTIKHKIVVTDIPQQTGNYIQQTGDDGLKEFNDEPNGNL